MRKRRSNSFDFSESLKDLKFTMPNMHETKKLKKKYLRINSC